MKRDVKQARATTWKLFLSLFNDSLPAACITMDDRVL